MQTWQTLDDGTKWAFQLDGIITRTSKSQSIGFSILPWLNTLFLLLGTTGGNMIVIQNANDFEFFSSTGKGAIQGNGYQARNAGLVMKWS